MGVLRVLLDNKSEVVYRCLVFLNYLIGLCPFVDIPYLRRVLVYALRAVRITVTLPLKRGISPFQTSPSCSRRGLYGSRCLLRKNDMVCSLEQLSES